MGKWTCLECLKEFDLEPRYEHEEYIVKGKKVVITALKATCPCCGESLVNDEIENANLNAAYNTYRKEENLLTADEIREIRQKYGITQVGFSKILGFGEKTIARYENGALQDVAPNNLILLMKDRKNFMELWNNRKHLLSESEIEKVEKRLHCRSVKETYCPDSRYRVDSMKVHFVGIPRMGGAVSV